MNAEPLIVTGSPTLAQYLIERCGLPADVEVARSVTAEQIRGRHVYGFLPPHLACHANRVSTLTIGRRSMRHSDLTLDDYRRIGGRIISYRVTVISDDPPPSPGG